MIEETRVGGPEEADVGDLVEDHGDAFESESEGPADFVLHLCRNNVSLALQCQKGRTSVGERRLLDDSAPQDLEPFVPKEDFDFVTRGSEREERRYPADL